MQSRGDLDGAEAMFRKALEIEEKLGRLKAMASLCYKISLVMKTRGNMETARLEMLTKSRDLPCQLRAEASG